jgi:hypothetical protein
VVSRLRRHAHARILRSVKRFRLCVSRRLYYSVGLSLLSVLATCGPAAAQLELTVDPTMTTGPAAAPVTIVEFSDYQ